MDVNGDGKTDFVTCSYFGKNVGWVENPGKADKPWTYHEIDLPGPSEAAALVDLTGDGMPEVLPNAVNVVVWYKLEGSGPSAKWKKHDFGTAAAGHGVGSGDVNGDGRVDLLTPKGWFEGPADPSNDTWAWHPEWNLGATGIQILARDVDGDGLSDLVYGMGHDYGLFWLKQAKGADGERTWTKAEIDPTHRLGPHPALGRPRRRRQGRRARHRQARLRPRDRAGRDRRLGRRLVRLRQGVEALGQARRSSRASRPRTPRPKGPERDALKDFPAGTAGTGLQMTAIDIDRDGDIDLVCPGKSGLYLFENLGSAR